MQSPLQITFRNIAHSDALAEHIQERGKKLDAICDRIISCHVTVELVGHHHRGGERFHISINLGLPGHEVLANRHAHDDAPPEAASVIADRAFDEAERQLETWLQRPRARRQHDTHSPS
jgi:ribosome-associated translation inhibitor RaiA